MDVLRHFHHAQTFRLLAQDLSGRLTVERLADHLSALADIVLDARSDACWAHIAGPRRAAAALRDHRLRQARRQGAGLRRPTSTSCSCSTSPDDDPDAHAREFTYTRLAQRLNTWLTSTHRGGPAVRHRPAPAAGRREGIAGVEPARLRALPARAGVGVGAPGAHPRALRDADDADSRRRVRGRARRDPARMARDPREARGRGRRHAPQDARRASQPDRAVRPEARSGRHGRHRVHRAMPRARARAPPPATLTRNAGNIALLRMAGELGLVPESPRARSRRCLPRLPQRCSTRCA